MIRESQNRQATKEQRKILSGSFLAITPLLFCAAGFIWGWVLNLKIVGQILSNTLGLYSIPHDVVDELTKALLERIYILGMIELGVIAAIAWILNIMRLSSARIKNIESGAIEGEENNAQEESES